MKSRSASAFLFTVTISLFSWAQMSLGQTQANPPMDDLSRKAYDVASQVQRSQIYLTPDQKTTIDRLLNEVTNTIYQNSGSISSLRCVTRDNDGSNPWMLATREGVNDVRIPGTVFSTRQLCDAAIKSIQYKGGVYLLCTTRDNDGSNPYNLGVIDPSTKTFNALGKSLIFRDLQSCQMAVNDGRDSATGVTLCSSRDRDGSNPWSMFFIDRNLNIQIGTETYNGYESCRSNL